MFRSMVTKLWVTTTALIMTVLLIFTMFLSKELEMIYFSNQVTLMKEHAEELKGIVTSDLPPSKVQQNIEFGQKMSHYTITVFDNNGVVKYSSDTKHSPLGKKSDWVHMKRGIESNETYYSGYNPELKMEMTATFLPFTDKTGQKFMLMVHAPTSELMEMIKATKRTAYWILSGFLLFSIIFGWFLSKWVSQPIINIRKTALKMAQGDFSTLIETTRDDELGDLAKAMNILTIRLDRTLNSLKNANSELTLLLEKWREFLADVSHELRTPLFLIQGYSEAITDNVVKDDQTKGEYLAVISKESTRLQKLVNQLLDIESGLPVNKTPVNLHKLINDAIRPFEIMAGEKKIAIRVEPTIKKVGLVNIDPDKLGEVIYNLVDNALRYTPPEGTVAISGELLPDSKLELKVSDTGTGIAATHLPRLFERFYRVDKARSRSRGGTGLGLAIVKKIVDQHGGTITVKSKVNKGTTFIITLPL